MSRARGEPQPAALVVGIAASAGGLAAMRELVGALPEGGPIAWVVAPHLDPHAPSHLAEVLGAHVHVPVTVVEDGAQPAPGHVYVAPPGRSVALRAGRLRLEEIDPGPPSSADHLLRSLAEELGGRAAGVVLSGTGRDGTAGLRAVREAGGLAVAQRPESAAHASMPRSAIEAGVVDLVLEPEAIPAAIRGYVDATRERSQPLTPETLDALAELMAADGDPSLADYKGATVSRRVRRRMGLLGVATVAEYLERLRQDPAERAGLRKEVLINVTDFFRDPDAFEALRHRALAELAQGEEGEEGEPLRAWVAACATGEEAYTIAMLLVEAVEAAGRERCPVKVFATDIDPQALAVARRGRYPEMVCQQVGPERLARFFVRDGEGWSVAPRLRDLVTFALHDACNDPPFGGMHLVSCRNLLIYLQPAARRRVLEVLNVALRPDGFLLLGRSESATDLPELYTEVDGGARLYRKTGAVRPSPLHRTVIRGAGERGGARSRGLPAVSEQAREALLQQLPPSVVVGSEGEILFSTGRLDAWLSVPTGAPTTDLASMLRPGLVERVRAALQRCRRGGGAEVVEVDAEGPGPTRITLRAIPSVHAGAVALSFEPAAREVPSPPRTHADRSLVEALRAELEGTREDLRATVADLEAANDDLRFANEEAASVNEELQAANEELEASTEELRSLNEELEQVNSRLRGKVSEVERARDDIDNLLASTDIAVLFLDRGLRLRRVTAAARALLQLTDADLGRPIEEVASGPLAAGLAEEVRSVLSGGTPAPSEVRTADGRWASRRIRPYRTAERELAGVVVALVDVTDLKQASESLRVRAGQQRVIARLGLKALEEPDLLDFLGQVVREVGQTLDADIVKVLELQPGGEELVLRAGTGFRAEELGHRSETTGLGSPAGYTLTTGEPLIVEDLLTDRRFEAPPLLREHAAQSGMNCLIRGEGRPYGVLGAYTRARRNFSQDDTTFLEAAANVLAGAIARRRNSQRVQAEREVGRILSEPLGEGVPPSLETLAPRLIDALCATLRMDLGELWQRSPEHPDLLVCTAFRAPTEPSRQAELREALHADARFRLGEGLAGRAFVATEPLFASNRTDEAAFPRVAFARALGLRSALAFSVRSADTVHAVITLFARRGVPPDRLGMQSLENIGYAIGQAVRRADAEQALRQSEALKSAVLDAALDAILVMDHRGRVLESNGRTEAMFGWSPAEMVGAELGDRIVPPALRERHRQGLARHLETGDGPLLGRRIRVSGLRRDGTEFPVELGVSRIDLPGPPVFTGFVRDVTDLVAAEEALRDSEARFREVLEGAPDPMLVYDESGRVVVRSRSWPAGPDGEPESVEAAARALLGPGEEELRAFLGALWPTEETRPVELGFVGPRGEPRTLLVRSASLRPLRDRRRVRICTATDITEQKRAQAALQEADRQKDNFLAMLGHELRNPLAAIRSTAEVLERLPTGDERLARAGAILRRQSSHMARLVDGLLDVSRILNGKLPIELEVVDLVAVLRGAIDDRRAEIAHRALVLDVRLPDRPLHVEGDPVRLAQVFDNLLSNAVRFTPAPGTIHVTCGEVDGGAEVAVADTGRGIPANLLPLLFEPFRQAEQSLDRPSGGLGLGLALVKGITELLGGEVTASSAGPGKGARFVVRLPICTGSPRPEPGPAHSGGGARIVVVEDNADAARLLRDLLESEGHEVRVANDGREGLRAIRELAPHLVLCDIGLPDGMSGYDVARAVRAEPALASTRLVAVTGYGTPDDVRRAREAGFDAHLTKPVDLDQIERIVLEATGRDGT